MSEVSLARYFRVVWRWLWLILACTLVGAATTYLATRSLPRTYAASITLAVGDDSANPNLTGEQISVSERLVASYIGMARRQSILEATAQALGLPGGWQELQPRVVAARLDSQLFEVRVVDSDPTRAAAIAGEIARQLVLQSPTTEGMRQIEAHRAFVEQQLETLKSSIAEAEAALAQQQAALAGETSARGVLDRQDQIQALELKLANWRPAYASLLSSYQGKGANTLTIVGEVHVPTQPVGPDVRMYILAGAMTAAALSLLAAFLIEYWDDSLRAPDEVSRLLGLPILGAIARFRRAAGPGDAVVTALAPAAPDAEAFRVLWTNVQFSCPGAERLRLVVTSPGIGEGKSTVSANLAVAFAQGGRRTILVDADLRHPSLHLLLRVHPRPGLASLLTNGSLQSTEPDGGEGTDVEGLRRQLEANLANTATPRLRLLATSEARDRSPAELLASSRMAAVLRCLAEMAEVVILDCPPVEPVADTSILATDATGVVLVVEAGRTSSRAARAAVETLGRARARVLGVALNRVPRSSSAYYRRRRAAVAAAGRARFVGIPSRPAPPQAPAPRPGRSWPWRHWRSRGGAAEWVPPKPSPPAGRWDANAQ